MELSVAMQLAARQGCELYWEAEESRWVIAAIAYDADACSLSAAQLARISEAEFLARFIPDRP